MDPIGHGIFIFGEVIQMSENNRVVLRIYNLQEDENKQSSGVTGIGLIPTRPIPQKKWDLLYHLVRIKKGYTDGDLVDEYLKDFFNVPQLRLVTREQVEGVIRFLSTLPNKAS